MSAYGLISGRSFLITAPIFPICWIAGGSPPQSCLSSNRHLTTGIDHLRRRCARVAGEHGMAASTDALHAFKPWQRLKYSTHSYCNQRNCNHCFYFEWQQSIAGKFQKSSVAMACHASNDFRKTRRKTSKKTQPRFSGASTSATKVSMFSKTSKSGHAECWWCESPIGSNWQ